MNFMFTGIFSQVEFENSVKLLDGSFFMFESTLRGR